MNSFELSRQAFRKPFCRDRRTWVTVLDGSLGFCKLNQAAIEDGTDSKIITKEIDLMLWNLLWVGAIILDIFALSDVMKSNRDTASKIVLMALILLFPFFAAAIYMLVFRNKHAY